MLIAAVDPGLDRAVAAIFDSARAVGGVLLQPAAYVGFTVQETSPRERLSARLATLHAWAVGLGRDYNGELGAVYVEVPAMAGGGYRGKRTRHGVVRNAREMGLYHMALGSLLAGFHAGSLAVVEVQASGVPKVKRHQFVDWAFKAAGRELVAVGPRGGRDEDLLDAVYVGLSVTAPRAA